MKKIILAVDIMQPDTAALDYACYLARLTRSRLVGVFLENLETGEIVTPRQLSGKLYMDAGISTALPENEAKRNACEQAIQQFKEGCAAREVSAVIHRDRGMPLEELVEESRFADLLVIPSGFEPQNAGSTGDFIQRIASKAECPVLISAPKFYIPKEIIFAYDGSKSAMLAIKHFTYLFPQLSDKPIHVVQTRKGGNYLHYQYKLKELMTLHYTDVTLLPLTGSGNEDDILFRYMLAKEHALLIMGAFGRSDISRLLRPSAADPVLRWLTIPVFIAHP